MQDGTETGTDCGGDCPDCVPDSPFTLNIDGVAIEDINVVAALDTSCEQVIDTNVIFGSTMGFNFLCDNNTKAVNLAFSVDYRDGMCATPGAYTTLLDTAYLPGGPFFFGIVSYVDLSTRELLVSNHLQLLGQAQTITLASCNSGAKKISGSFNTLIVTNPTIPDTLNMTVSGAFNDLSFIVQ